MTGLAKINNSFPIALFRLTIGLCLALASFAMAQRTVAQDGEEDWSLPVNLSNSGGASQPRIVTTTDGRSQAFWWDRFDGLTSAVFDGVTWSEPFLAPIRSEQLATTPYIVIDANEGLHAFWVEQDAENENETKLTYSQMLFGSAEWTFPELVAQSAATFDVTAGASGGVGLTYIRTLNTPEEPAGVYFRKNPGNGTPWEPSIPIETSKYFRILTPETAHVRVAASQSDETLYLVWEEPDRDGSKFVVSFDGGSSWFTTPEKSLGSPQDPASYPQVVALPDDQGALLLWESTQESGCTIYQRRINFYIQDELDPSNDFALGDPDQIMEGLLSCPREDRFWQLVNGILWLWGQGSNELSLSSLQSNLGEWTLPINLSFNFEDPATGQSVNLNELRASFGQDQMTVIGTDQVTGEVWATTGQTSTLDMVSAPPTLWTSPLRVSQEDSINGLPVVGIDQKGRISVIWSGTSGSNEALFYVRSIFGNATNPIPITPASQGSLARQPSLMLENLPEDEDLLHLVWSGGNENQIFYSHTLASNTTSGGWINPQTISAGDPGSWPEIERDLSGRLYVIYAVTLNEERGVYLVYSDDNGENWSNPIKVFDAAEAGYDMLDHPTLAIGPDDSLHVAWVEAPLPGMGMTRNIFYSRSNDRGLTWSEPFIITSSGYDWPQLSVIDDQVHVLLLRPESGGVYHRWSLAGPDGETGNWSTIAGVPGCQDTQAPFGVAASFEKLHLVCTGKSSSNFSYSSWRIDEEFGGRWSSPETISPQIYGIEQLQDFLITDQGAALAINAEQGDLAVSWLAPSNLQTSIRQNLAGPQTSIPSAIFLTDRAIPSESPPPNSFALPAATPTISPTIPTSPELNVVDKPTATPDLSIAPPPQADSNQPLIFGIGFSLFVVGGIFTGWILWQRRR